MYTIFSQERLENGHDRAKNVEKIICLPLLAKILNIKNGIKLKKSVKVKKHDGQTPRQTINQSINQSISQTTAKFM